MGEEATLISVGQLQIKIKLLQMNSAIPQYKGQALDQLASSTQDGLPEEEEYLSQLKESLVRVAAQLQANSREMKERYVRREEVSEVLGEKDQAIQSILHQNSQLRNQNYNFKIKLEQYDRHLKRYDIKLSLLNSKLFHLNKILHEKQAIIKYLQSKTEHAQRNPRAVQPAHLADASIEDYSRTYSKTSLSFAKLKTPNLKFEDYANYSLQIEEEDEHFQRNQRKGRVNRIKTQTNQSKQNQKVENQREVGSRKFQQFFNPKVIGKVENQKTLIKGGSKGNTTFWDYSGPKRIAQTHESKENIKSRKEIKREND